MKVERDTIAYNLGLAYARANMLKDSSKVLHELVDLNRTPGLVDKAKALIGRVDVAIKSNQKIKLNVNTEAKLEIIIEPPVKPVALHLQAGQMCLHGLFDASDLYVGQARDIVANGPTFNRAKQQTITRTKAS